MYLSTYLSLSIYLSTHLCKYYDITDDSCHRVRRWLAFYAHILIVRDWGHVSGDPECHAKQCGKNVMQSWAVLS